MPTDAWQSALATLFCMTAICAVFMGGEWRTVLLAGISIGSIILGTLGILAWMDVTMDPIMMAALVISIGFSIDIPAHVSYHFYSSGFELKNSNNNLLKQRLTITLLSVSIPALQAAISTSLCVLALLLVPLYMAQVFVKIMFTCIILCIIHSLIIIPALIVLTDEILIKLNLFYQKNKTKLIKN
ncbi:hypothetical protein Mgra_00001838 [Meloidogyne graminicola]|uniref:SSD domain-containing protein n=1 Tax=Meloidogyne graminicola TaxID=189291 RepID=A0A8S9ZYP6_9BILA|nr:hypothetical protein Mgra_00001838 [Meloidogyne graminicola]